MTRFARFSWALRCGRRAAAVLLTALTGCQSLMNGWLDLTAVGNFRDSSTQEIRTSLTLEDTPSGIPGAVFPSREDLIAKPVEYPISQGDTLNIEIYELRQRLVPYQAQVTVSPMGDVNLPVVGRVHAAGLTVPEFEDAVADALRARDVLVDPDVTVNPLFLQNATYSIFGIGVSASNNAPLRAGTFPIRRPDLRILDAINDVGGLNEFVVDVYVFRDDHPSWMEARKRASQEPPGTPKESGPDAKQPSPPTGASETEEEDHESSARSPEEALIDAVVAGRRDRRRSGGEKASRDGRPSLEADRAQPYIWVNNQFVPNPGYTKPPDGDAARMGRLEPTAPAVDWDRIAGDTASRIIRIPAELLRAGDPLANIVIRGGDILRIVSGEIGVYYVMGQVNRVGPFAFNTEPVTLKAAIAAAGGLTGLAWPDRCTVYRRVGQREQMIQVNLDRIFAGKDADFMIKRGDIINVGTHPLAPFLRTLRGLTLPNPVTNVGYSFTYARNFADIDTFAARRNPANEPNRFPNLFP